MIRVRKAKFEEVPAIRELAIEVFTDAFAASNTPENLDSFFRENYSLEKFLSEFKEPDSILYIALDDLKIIGYLRLRKSPEVDAHLGTNHIEMQRLYVHRDYQGTSVARRLMEHAIEYAKKKKFEWMWLGVWEKNTRAQKFYAKWGFERFSEHIFNMGDDPQTDWLLKKKL
ncbi:MAG: GNAT family N-acetyltransferase [Bacteroidetes bacterium]|nr:GNAT family N-acetyltransferase [Bacteroidota bacterium]MBS1539851.1 GNAT family N-acetyltransferase [Bacteroidota bacterium]